MAGLSINSVVLTVIAVAVGLVMVGSLLAPIATDVMDDLTALGGDGVKWSGLVGVVVMFSILGLIIVAVNSFTRK